MPNRTYFTPPLSPSPQLHISSPPNITECISPFPYTLCLASVCMKYIHLIWPIASQFSSGWDWGVGFKSAGTTNMCWVNNEVSPYSTGNIKPLNLDRKKDIWSPANFPAYFAQDSNYFPPDWHSPPTLLHPQMLNGNTGLRVTHPYHNSFSKTAQMPNKTSIETNRLH